MNMMKWLGLTIAAALALLVGCSALGTSGEPDPAPESSAAPAPVAAAPAQEADDSAKPADNAEETKQKNNIAVASPQTQTIDPSAEEDLYMNEDDRRQMKQAEEARQEFNRRNYDVEGAFDPLHPTLMGISIGAAADGVKKRFGEPTGTYPLPDDEVSASVLSYPGFSIGVRDDKVLFVEVSTRSVNPGLNGLRLGDGRDAAFAKLGEPTADSEFVISYVANGSVLKLDLDPETGQIHSIKLFPEE
ncbi:hypothetical protein [Paenibacillus sp.]|uniref:hypothetical protein n=1 Tax=Paenibacillus sp. TaxID=58172 RepID=UPI002D79289C|nr:hypothetical protein [Paenibacillus sp.]